MTKKLRLETKSNLCLQTQAFKFKIKRLADNLLDKGPNQTQGLIYDLRQNKMEVKS